MTIAAKFLELSHSDDVQDGFAGAVAFGIKGIVNKATEGPGMIDKTFAIRRPVAAKAGLLYGGYHFIRPGDQDQAAAHFLETVGDPTGLHLMGDWEVPQVDVPTARQWFGAVHDKVGRWPSCYSYAAMLTENFGSKPDPFFAQLRLWVAQYGPQPHYPTQIWPTWWGWQFTGDGNGPEPHNVPGIVLVGSKGIDINVFNGTDDELAASWAS